MRVQLHDADFGCRTALSWECGPYDALTPVSYLTVESRLRYANPDRLAIACALLLHDFVAGRLTCPKPCSPEVAREIEAWFAPLDVRVDGVEYRPSAKPKGTRTALVIPDMIGSSDHEAFGPFDVCVSLASDQQFKSSISVSRIEFASNLRLLTWRRHASRVLGLLGLCVMFAEDFGISTIVSPILPQDMQNQMKQLARIGTLANLELRWVAS